MSKVVTEVKIANAPSSTLTNPLIEDRAGDLFGVTTGGQQYNDGGIYEIVNTAAGYSSTPTVLASFDPTGIGLPVGSLASDPAGNLFGVTQAGGNDNDPAVFELTKTPTGYGTVKTLVTLSGMGVPTGGLISDAAGDLFGTVGPGNLTAGAVFELPKTATGYGAPTILVQFSNNGGTPNGGLIMDTAGDLFGTTTGGADGGSVFEIPKTASGYATAITLAAFNDYDVAVSGVVMDAAGDLFGTTNSGGTENQGSVFEIAKTAAGYASTPATLYSFNPFANANALPYNFPQTGLVIDAAGDLFGTVRGPGYDSAIFEIARTSAGYASTPAIVTDIPSSVPQASSGLLANSAGDLFDLIAPVGVFEITNSGFVAGSPLACYLRGTRIATPTGERAIESLAAGDLVLTGSGEVRPIVWMGHRHLDCRRHPKPRDMWPVRVRCDAFGPGRPHRDLLLSPDHSVFVDDALIPVRYLINGATIVQEMADSVTYWHLELDRHDVILAEGLPCETYLDTGNRGAFANGGPPVHLHPDFALRIWDAEACAPLVLAGPRLMAARRRLLAQALCLGHAMGDDPGLRLLVDGAEVFANSHGRQWRVRLPETTQCVRLISHVWSPAQMRPDQEDTRALGVAISRIWLDGREVSLESSGLSGGWHAPEPGWRWTDGDAVLALAGVRELAFAIAMTGSYWQRTSPGPMRTQGGAPRSDGNRGKRANP